MPTSDINEFLKEYNVLLGGYGPSIEYEELTDTEMELLDKFLDEVVESFTNINSYIAELVDKNRNLVKLFAEIFKAKVSKPFGGEIPNSNNFGIALLAPFDLKYVGTPSADNPAYTSYSETSWLLSITANNVLHILGDGTNFFKMSPTTGKRAIAVIFQNGFIEVGTTPSFDQFQAKTEKVNYAPFRAHTLQDVKIDPYRSLYVYRTPFAIPLWYDFGIMLDAMPRRTGTADLRLLGVVFYEYGFYSSLVGTR